MPGEVVDEHGRADGTGACLESVEVCEVKPCGEVRHPCRYHRPGVAIRPGEGGLRPAQGALVPFHPVEQEHQGTCDQGALIAVCRQEAGAEGQ